MTADDPQAKGQHEREAFLFFRSFYEALEQLPKEAQLPVYRAICQLALDGELLEPLEGTSAAVFTLIRPVLEKGMKKALAGRLGAEKRWETIGKKKTVPQQTDDKAIANAWHADSKAMQDKDKDIRKESRATKPPTPARFVPPTLEQVATYCQERKNGIDPQHFVDYYEARGWKLGKNNMKDWRATIRTWEKQGQNGAPNPSQRKEAGTFFDFDREGLI